MSLSASTTSKEGCLLPSQVFGRRRGHTVTFAPSPRMVSMREGDLPPIDLEMLKRIESFMKGERGADFINYENYRDVLHAVKVIDLDLDRHPMSRKDYAHSTFALRELCLYASGGRMNSYEAFTKSINPKYYINQFSPEALNYASQLENYVPERVAQFAPPSAKFVIEAMCMSRRLDMDEPTTFVLRGNCGTGKTFASKRHPQLIKGLDEHGEPTGTLALDSVKATLRKGVNGITNQQIHVEGYKAAYRLIGDLEKDGRELTMVRDEIFASVSIMQGMIDKARASKKPLVIVDNDAPLMVSCLRVLQRDIYTEPCIPLGPIENGYKITKAGRADVIKLVQNSQEVTSYELWVTDPSGKVGLAARKTAEGMEIVDRGLYEFAIDKDTIEKEVAEVRGAVITKALIGRFAKFGIRAERLEPFIGMRFEEALLAHSLRLPTWY